LTLYAPERCMVRLGNKDDIGHAHLCSASRDDATNAADQGLSYNADRGLDVERGGVIGKGLELLMDVASSNIGERW
jgi:hypothetical protein